jgi:DNA mismatch repair protein MSH2
VRSYRAEVYTKPKGTTEWIIQYKGSPGNLLQFEDLLFTNNDMIQGTALMALQLGNEGGCKTVGMTCIETKERHLSITEFADDSHFTELEALIVLTCPKECLLPNLKGDFEEIEKVLKRNGVMVTVRKKKDYLIENDDLVQDLNKLLHFDAGQQKNANTLLEMSNKIAMSALAAAIRYLELVNDVANHGNFKLELLNLNRFVHLDGAAVSALNIFPKPGTIYTSPSFKWTSLLGVLDHCQTPQGHRLLAKWLKQPLKSIELIRDRHNIVECLLDSSTARSTLHGDYLKRMPDILQYTKKLMRKKTTLQDIFRLYQVKNR